MGADLAMIARKRKRHDQVIDKQKKVQAVAKATAELEASKAGPRIQRVHAEPAEDSLVSETFATARGPLMILVLLFPSCCVVYFCSVE